MKKIKLIGCAVITPLRFLELPLKSLCKKEEKKIFYIGETSRSSYEILLEHMILFKGKKEGDPEKNQANSVLWAHSKDSHHGLMKTFDLEIKITSSHRYP